MGTQNVLIFTAQTESELFRQATKVEFARSFA